MKTDDYVICINDHGGELTIGKKYKIIGTYKVKTFPQDSFNWVVVSDDNDTLNSFSSTRFIPLQIHRENQLDKIIDK